MTVTGKIVFRSDLEYDFDTEPSHVTAVAGHATYLLCRPPMSFPPASVTWYKDGELLRLSASTRLFPAEVTSSGDLQFANVQLGDDGSYVCVATNDFASRARRASAPAILTVLGKDQIPLCRLLRDVRDKPVTSRLTQIPLRRLPPKLPRPKSVDGAVEVQVNTL